MSTGKHSHEPNPTPQRGAEQWKPREAQPRQAQGDASRGVSMPARRKHKFFYELLWPLAATFLWNDQLFHSYPIWYEDNSGAESSLRRAFSSDFAASLILALFWGSAA